MVKLLHTIVICIIFFQTVELRSVKIEVDSNEESLAFRLIHINDIHAHYDQVNENTGRCKSGEAASNSCFGGIARVKTAVDGIRNLEPDMESIFLNAGDYYQVAFFRKGSFLSCSTHEHCNLTNFGQDWTENKKKIL